MIPFGVVVKDILLIIIGFGIGYKLFDKLFLKKRKNAFTKLQESEV